MVRLSGVQREVLGLYRSFFRAAKNRPDQDHVRALVRQRFRARIDWPRRDVDTIENWLRHGRRQLTLLHSTTAVTHVAVNRDADLRRRLADEHEDD